MTPAAAALALKALAMVEALTPANTDEASLAAARAAFKQLTDAIERDHAAAAPARKY
jgi:hypothetical protein